MLEVLLIPNVYRRWKELNPRYPEIVVERHPGEKYPEGLARREKIADWSAYAGYTLAFSEGLAWNRVGIGTERGFSHGPSRCWDGVRRETQHDFVYQLYVIWSQLSQGQSAQRSVELLPNHVKFVDDREGATC